MTRRNEVRISNRTAELLQYAILMTHAEDGIKLTKAAMSERLIDLGAQVLSREQNWDIPDRLRGRA